MAAGQEPVTLNLNEAAVRFGRTVNTIRSWIGRGCPVFERGGQGKEWRLDPEAVDRWLSAGVEARRAEDEAKAAAMQSLDLEEPAGDQEVQLHLRERYYKSVKEQIKLDRERRFLVETATVRQEFIETFAYISDRLQALPDLVERRCNPAPEVIELLEEMIDEFQAELAKRCEEIEDLGQTDHEIDLLGHARESA